MSVKSSTELMLYVVLTMPTLNKAYLLLFIFIMVDNIPLILLWFHKISKLDSSVKLYLINLIDVDIIVNYSD
jgi:hypothetical protein